MAKIETSKTETAVKMGKPGDEPLKLLGKRYSSVSELVRDSSDAETADSFDKHQSDRRLVRSLIVMRCFKEVSQVDLAKRMKCAQSKVSKIESSVDADLNFGDVVRYSNALGQAVSLRISPAGKSGADRIRFHVDCIKREVDRLVELAGDDKTIGDGVEALALRMVGDMVQLIEKSLQNLPSRSQAQPHEQAQVSVDVEGESGHRLSLDEGPKRVRRSDGKKAAPVG